MTDVRETDLLIIGAGMAGMASAVFAARRGMRALVAGGAGGFDYSSGLLDLWGKSLAPEGRTGASGKISRKPWDMIGKLPGLMPDHPYARLETESIRQAFSELTDTLEKNRLSYVGYDKKNTLVATPFGTLHPTYRLPATMRSNAEAVKDKAPCLILDFTGLREFSARFFTETLKKNWPGLESDCIEFPGMGLRTEVFTPFLARSLETEKVQGELIRRVRPLVKKKAYLGFPAVLGVATVNTIHARLEAELGVKVFEIPTSPVSVAGIRLKEALMASLSGSSVTLMPNYRVTKVMTASNQGFELCLGTGANEVRVRASAVILATGRFLSRGLVADRETVRETVFNLPVRQPDSRELWHRQDFFSPKGHRINQAGLETDSQARPVDRTGEPVFKTLFAAGAILAGQDWMRQKCGAGLSIGTGFQAIQSCLQICPGT